MFELRGLHAYYGKSHVVQGVSLQVGAGEAVGLVGRNGVGKTTTLKAIIGLLRRTRGEIRFAGQEISKLPTHRRAALGLGYVPEERAVFADMSVEENIRIGAFLQAPADQRRCLAEAYAFFPILQERREQLAGTLSGGQQKILALARGLALRPRLLLVDEPSEGLMPMFVAHVGDALARAAASGNAILLVDASYDLLRRVCTRLYVMDRGLITGVYRPEEFAGPDALAAAYLGVEAHAGPPATAAEATTA
ncbi:MAG TPA: ABC transporter ATP-binding protein [Dehalococcoidia bacterium]|jgi:branched-chain amino acid transport system ATP-binding protein